jgi:hypothetical protein
MEKQKEEAKSLQSLITTIGKAINEIVSSKGDKKN